ncbi:MAG: kelch repeat-containing protein, partial [Candidatus Bathyarchaeia archaeon]
MLICSDASLSALVASSEEDSWTTKTSMPTARAGLGVVVVDGKIYAIGGYNGDYLGVNEMYDPETDTWMTMEPMPTPRVGFAVVVCQKKVYCIGGVVDYVAGDGPVLTGKLEVYDPSTNKWETKTSMPTLRSSLAANVVDNKIYLIGGRVYPYISTKNEVYSPTTDSWSIKSPDIPSPLYSYVSAVIDDEIYIIGGRSYWMASGGAPLPPPVNETWIYEPQTETWSSGKPLFTLVAEAATAVTTGVNVPQKIYVIGGRGGLYLDETTSQVSVYDPKKKTWTYGEELPTKRWG